MEFLQMDRVLLFHNVQAFTVRRMRHPFMTVMLAFHGTSSTSVDFADPMYMPTYDTDG